MAKKFFEAMIFGVKEFFRENGRLLMYLISLVLFILLFMATPLSDATGNEDPISVGFVLFSAHMFIYIGIMRCVDAARHAKENECDMRTAWNATKTEDDMDIY